MRSSFKVVVFLLAALLGNTLAQTCSNICPRSLPTQVVPTVESTYVYSLEAKSVLNPSNSQQITIKGDAEVAIQNVCESVLRLKNVVIEGVANGAELATQLSNNPFAFGYFNGKIRGVCPTKDEEEWAVNMKKAVVSALQVSSTAEDGNTEIVEQDFAGKCNTEIRKIESSADNLVLEKKKNLNRCSDRRVDLRYSPLQLLGQVSELIHKYASLMDSDQICTITLNNKVVKQTKCEETSYLIYRSNKPILQSSIKLTLKETKPGVAADLANREVKNEEIFFAYEHKHSKTATEADTVAILKELCTALTDPTLETGISAITAKLIQNLNELPTDVANSVDEAVKSGSICPAASKGLRDIFLDSAAHAASDASIKIFVKAHNNGELSPLKSALDFPAIALRAAPNEETIKSLLPLIESETSSRPLLLGLSILTQRYCQKTKDCETNASVQQARDAYVARIGKTTDKLTKITLIKALENLNVNKNKNENVIKLLDEVINSEEAGDSARTAAVKALPNEESINDQLKGIVLKEANPNEVRIAAFQKLATNNGLKDVNELLKVQEHCVKNYILSYVKNLKNSKNPARKNLIPESVTLTEEPSLKIGNSKNIAYEYGPVVVEVDVVYPKNSNATQSITSRISRVHGDKIEELTELTLRQEGFDKQIGNVLNVISRKISPTEFGFEVVKDISDIVAKLKSKEHTHNHLQAIGRINQKNVVFLDLFEDLHTLIDLIKKFSEKIIADKKVDFATAASLVNSKVAAPTLSGVPVIYKLKYNLAIVTVGDITGEGNKRNLRIKRSATGAVHGSAKLKLKDQKVGYEYDSKFAFTPKLDIEAEKKDTSVSLKFKEKNEKIKIFTLQQSLKETQQAGVGAPAETELAPEPRSEDCIQPVILKLCYKSSQVKGLLFPNLEVFLAKPDPAIEAIQLDLAAESPTESSKKLSAKLYAVGGAQNYEHLAQFDVSFPKNAKKELKILLKSPENSFETNFDFNLDQTSNLGLKLKLPKLIDLDVTTKSEKDKESNAVKNDLLISYKFPEDPTTHTLKIKQSLGYNLKRSGKDKVANLDWYFDLQSSRRPYLNHHSLVQFKYRPFKLNEIVLEFGYGEKQDNLYKFSRLSKIDVQEYRPFKMNSTTDINLVATDFDVNYELQAENRVLNDKGNALEFDYNLKGKDRSKRAIAAGGNNEIDGKLQIRNKGSSIDSTIDATLNLMGREMAWNSQLKQVEPQKYEGKITVQTDKDKKIFISHKEEISKPTKDINLQSEADITYSYKPDKRKYKLEAKKQGSDFLINGVVTNDDKTIYSHDVKFEGGSGKFTAKVNHDPRSYDLEVNNLLRPTEAKLKFKNKNREYDVKVDRVPYKFLNIKIDGNDEAYVKKGEAHLSIVDPIKVDILTKNKSVFDLDIDVLSLGTKKATLKVDSPKFNFKHDGSLEYAFGSHQLSWKTATKKNDREYKTDAQLTLKESSINYEKVTPTYTSNVKYLRKGDKVEIDIDTEDIQGKVEGNIKTGKISLKNKEKNFEIESTYKIEKGKLIIESGASKNAKLEANIGLLQASKFVLETPSTKANLDFDLTAPVKKLKFDFDNPRYQKKIDAEVEIRKHFKYSSYGKVKADNKEQKIEINGVPFKALNIDVDIPDFKFKIKQPEGAKKIEFSYTFNDYTESEEFDFDPNKAYLVNWLSALRQYIKTFIVQN